MLVVSLSTNRKASPVPPTGQEKPMSNHRNPPVARERERERERERVKPLRRLMVSSYLLGVSVWCRY